MANVIYSVENVMDPTAFLGKSHPTVLWLASTNPNHVLFP